MIDHMAFVVEDPERQAEILQKFGYEMVRRTSHHAGSVEVADPRQPGLILELCTRRPQDAVGFNHAGLCIEGAGEAAALKAAGLEFLNEPHLSEETGRYVANFRDSDGIKWQITY